MREEGHCSRLGSLRRLLCVRKGKEPLSVVLRCRLQGLMEFQGWNVAWTWSLVAHSRPEVTGVYGYVSTAIHGVTGAWADIPALVQLKIAVWMCQCRLQHGLYKHAGDPQYLFTLLACAEAHTATSTSTLIFLTMLAWVNLQSHLRLQWRHTPCSMA